MIRLQERGEFKHNDVIQSEVTLTESVPRSKIREVLEVASAHILHCAGSSVDTKWTNLISDMMANDHSELRFQTDGASEDWLPTMYVPIDSVINNSIGGAYKIKSTNGNRLSRYIGQYWSLDSRPWIELTGSIPHDRVPTPTGQQEIVFGQNYMNNGSYVSARTKQLTPVKSIADKSVTVPKRLLREIHSTERRQSPSDNQIITVEDSPQQTSKETADIQEALDSPSPELRAYWKQQGDQSVLSSPRIIAGNDSKSSPGIVRRIVKQVKGFTQAASDSPTVGQSNARLGTAGNAKWNIAIYGRVATQIYRDMNDGKTPEHKALQVGYRKPWDKSGLGQGIESVRRSLGHSAPPDRSTGQVIYADLGQVASNLSWGNSTQRNESGGGWKTTAS